MFRQLQHWIESAGAPLPGFLVPRAGEAAVVPLQRCDSGTLAVLIQQQRDALSVGLTGAPLPPPPMAGWQSVAAPPAFVAPPAGWGVYANDRAVGGAVALGQQYLVPAPLAPAWPAGGGIVGAAGAVPAQPAAGWGGGAGPVSFGGQVGAGGARHRTTGGAAVVHLAEGLWVTNPEGPQSASYDHLIYAYFLENTRIVQIFRRAIERSVVGEDLRLGTGAAVTWRDTTEQLFFGRGGAPFGGVRSDLRDDPAATRRNAYWRMFGVDLNHGADDGQRWPYVRGSGANRTFFGVLEELFVQLGTAIRNADNRSGANPTNRGALQDLLAILRGQLLERRSAGNLWAEEFDAVALTSWLHVALYRDAPFVADLGCAAFTAEERLRRLGQRVGLPCHAMTRQYLSLAQHVSLLLQWVEAGVFTDTRNVDQLFAIGSSPRVLTEQILTDFSACTGRDLYAERVVAQPAANERVALA